MANRDGFEVDFTDYKERQSARLEPGKYLVRIVDAESGQTKNGDPKVTLFYTVVGTSFNGQPLVDTLTLTEKALFRLAKVLRAIGLPFEKKKLVIQFNKIVGRTMCVTVADGDEYNGVIKSEVRDYAAASMYEGGAEEPKKIDTAAQEIEQEVAFAEEQTYTEEFDGEDAHGWAARANEVDLPAEDIVL